MKKSLVILFSVCVVLLIVGCAANTPTGAVKSFIKAMIDNDSKAMAEVATPETAQLMAMFGPKMQEALAEEGISGIGDFTFSETINGDTAVVTMTDSSGTEENIDLIKVDGKWKVSMDMNK